MEHWLPFKLGDHENRCTSTPGGGRRLKEKESQQMIKTAWFLEAEQSQSWVTAAYADTPRQVKGEPQEALPSVRMTLGYSARIMDQEPGLG